MADRLPIVQAAGELQQLQSADTLDIPLNEQVAELQLRLNLLITFLVTQGFELPDELINKI